jgi:hypothetical protein
MMMRYAEVQVHHSALIISFTRHEKSLANRPLAMLKLERFGLAIPLEMVMELN